MKFFKKIFFIVPFVPFSMANAQEGVSASKKHVFFSYDSLHQVDIVDVATNIFRKKIIPQIDADLIKSSHVHITVVPAAGYSLQTGWAALLSANVAINNNSKGQQNISTLSSSFTYSQYRQFIVPLHTNIWLKNGKYNFQSDWRYLKYPSNTYGLGTNTTLADGYRIDYSYVRLHQNITKKISRSLYAGLGLDADFYLKIKEVTPDTVAKTDFENYGLYKNETAVGPVLDLLYDSRRNSINPENGSYLNVLYRPKFKFMGSDANWQSILIEYKAYKKFPESSGNVIALWSYNWFTFGGKPPYLLLPSIGWDDFVNTGRGFIQGRYRGSDMVYLETEYRFLITSNGLLGGVVFANAETFSSRASTLAGNASFKTFDPIQPAYGAGIRIKVNKYSRANLCIDYGWGTGGSRGVAVNLGEVF
ncbi:MAG: hypothetical protein ACHQF0_15180 [Chitinophagales bacterium]